jgi:hypothetical protein
MVLVGIIFESNGKNEIGGKSNFRWESNQIWFLVPDGET